MHCREESLRNHNQMCLGKLFLNSNNSNFKTFSENVLFIDDFLKRYMFLQFFIIMESYPIDYILKRLTTAEHPAK